MSYSYYNTGRPVQADAFVKFQSCYMDVSNTPLYPFGYGLSYTTFSYSPITLSSNELTNNGEIEAKVTVNNTGKCEGTEVVQLYIRDLVGSVTRPVKELKGFKRLEYVCEPGEFEVMIGTNSADVQSAKFALK